MDKTISYNLLVEDGVEVFCVQANLGEEDLERFMDAVAESREGVLAFRRLRALNEENLHSIHVAA